MHYLIDGYNLLFRSLRSSEENFKALRESFINNLARQIKTARLSVTLIFDSHHIEGLGDRLAKETILIHFTDHKQTADEYILTTLMKSPNSKEITVVTSDSRLAWAARGKGAYSLSVEDFRVMLIKKELKEGRKGDGKGVARKDEKGKNEGRGIKDEVRVEKKKVLTDVERWEEAFGKEEKDKDEKKKKRDELIRTEGVLTDKERWLREFEERDR